MAFRSKTDHTYGHSKEDQYDFFHFKLPVRFVKSDFYTGFFQARFLKMCAISRTLSTDLLHPEKICLPEDRVILYQTGQYQFSRMLTVVIHRMT